MDETSALAVAQMKQEEADCSSDPEPPVAGSRDLSTG